jgi:hypothetical protein
VSATDLQEPCPEFWLLRQRPDSLGHQISLGLVVTWWDRSEFVRVRHPAAYARRLFTSGPEGELPDIAERIVHRMERQHILYDESKRFRFVIPEAVLRWPYGPPDDPAVLDEHREQLARIETMIRRPNVEIGVLPLRPTAPWRLAGFDIYDDMKDGEPLVHLGSWLTRPYFISEPDQLEMCWVAFANLMNAAVTGEQARALVASVAAELIA